VHRTLVWLLALALSGLGVLAAHEIAYELTGTGSDGMHGYLAHAPQLGAVLATLTLAALVVTSRSTRVRRWPFPALALSAFAAMEHLERLLHTGDLPWLLTRPVFLLGLALQVPIALLAWTLARRLIDVVTQHESRRRPPRVPSHSLALLPEPSPLLGVVRRTDAVARAPPPSLHIG
jgi:hypothetical protein